MHANVFESLPYPGLTLVLFVGLTIVMSAKGACA